VYAVILLFLFGSRILEGAVMNTRFRFLLINYLSRSKLSRNSGFALPMAIMVGLCIIVVGMAVVIQAQGNKSKVTSQVTTSQANAIAEAGVAQYMNFLNQNRALLTYPDCDGTRDASTGACPDTGTATKSWSLVSNVIPSPLPQGGNACTNATSVGGNSSSTSTTTVSTVWANANNSTGWRSLNGGQFKLAGYKYVADGAANTAPGTAVLAVQGISGSGSNQGRAQLKLVIPISTIAGSLPPIPQVNTPGLWARSFSTGANVHANVLDSSGCTSGNTPFPSANIAKIPAQPIGTLPNGNHTPPLSTTMGVITKDTKGTPFPPLPYYPTTTEFATLVSQNKVNSLSSCAGKTAYPADGDKDADGNTFSASSPPAVAKVYKYRITGGCTLPSGVTFGTSSGLDRIILYVDSTLNIGNNARIAVNGSNKAKVQWLLKTANLDLGGNSQVGSANPTASTATNWAFFLYDGTLVSLRGTADYYAFIFAPKANADMRGNPKIAGALWVNSYQTNGAPPKVFQTIFKNDFNTLFSDLYADTGTDVSSLVAPNIMQPISSYSKTQFGEPITAVASTNSAPAVNVDTTPETPPSDVANDSCTVPNLSTISLNGKTATTLQTAVIAALSAAGFTGTPSATAVTTGDGVIQSHEPPANAFEPCSTSVAYTYKLPTGCTVPTLVGMATANSASLTTVNSAITNAQLVAGTATLISSGSNEVQIQNPAAGATATCGSTVTYSYRIPETIPAIPGSVTASSSRIPTISWGSVAGAASYQLYRCEANNNQTCAPATSSTRSYTGAATSYTEGTYTTNANKKWCYKVRATNSAGSSELSSGVCGT